MKEREEEEEEEDEDEEVGKVIEVSNKNIPEDFSSSILLQDNIGCLT